VAFNGYSFRQIYPQDAGQARAITAILPVAAGQPADRDQEARRAALRRESKSPLCHATLSNLYVRTLAGDESDLWWAH